MSNSSCRYTDDHQQAHKTSLEVLEQINELNVPATPVHFTLLYEMISQSDPELAEELSNLVEQKTYSDERARPLYRELLKRILHQHLPSEEVAQLINTVLGNLEHWSSQSTQQQNALQKNLACLARCETKDAVIQCINENIIPPIKQLSQNTQQLQNQLNDSAQVIRKLKQELEHATSLAKTDSLTGIPNRRGFDELVATRIEEAKTKGRTFCMLLLDLDFFKKVNDDFGHLVGDSVLRYVARVLHAETKGHDAIARLGGEEFVILLSEIAYNDAIRVAEKIRHRIERKTLRVKDHDQALHFTASLGVAMYQMGEHAEALFSRADQALYLAKNSGRNRSCGEHQL